MATKTNTPAAPSVDMSKFATIARNVRAAVVDGMLFLAIDPTAEGQPSSSGKNDVRASTGGNINLGAVGIDATLGLNYYTKRRA